MSTFELTKLVKQVCDGSLLTGEDELAKEVLTRIDRGDEHTALEQALPMVLQRFLSRDHRPLSAPGGQMPSGTQDTPTAEGAVPCRSRKVASIRSHWREQLQARVNVGYKRRKFFGDCTTDDLAFLAKHRRELAASNAATAEYLDTLAEIMTRHCVEVVRDLPEDAIGQLGGAQ